MALQLKDRHSARGLLALNNMRAGKWRKIAVLLTLILSALIAFAYTVSWSVARGYPFSIEYEGHVLWACAKLSQGQNPYSLATLSGEPWAVIIYNPLFLALGAGIMRLTEISFWPLRMISMVSTLAVFLLFVRLCIRSRINELSAIIGLVFFASCLPVFYWSSVARVDMLGLFFALIGLEQFVTAEQRVRRAEYKLPTEHLPSSLLFILAIFTKQQYVVLPLACTLFLLTEQRTRSAVIHLLSWLLPSALLMLILQAATSGGYFAHLTYASSLPWEWKTWKHFAWTFVSDARTLAAGAAIAGAALAGNLQNRYRSLALILLTVSFVPCMYTMGLRGAYHNHLLCLEFALFWLAAMSLKRLNYKITTFLVAIVLLCPGQIFDYFCELADRIKWRAASETTVGVLKRHARRGPVLAEDPQLAMAANCTPVIIDATTFMNMAFKYPEMQTSILKSIERKHFSAIIIDKFDAKYKCQRIWPRNIVEAINKNYRSSCASGGNGGEQILYLPKIY